MQINEIVGKLFELYVWHDCPYIISVGMQMQPCKYYVQAQKHLESLQLVKRRVMVGLLARSIAVTKDGHFK